MNRDAALSALRSEDPWDLVVIGGGATGLGCAVDAASRGYKTLVLERGDFAEATSSRSTKLIHGGVRYLAQGRIGLLREALAERNHLIASAPDLVRPLSFIVPSYRWWERPYHRLGLWIYDLLAGDANLARSRGVSANECLRLRPDLVPRRPRGPLRGGTVYFDALFDDARFALRLAQTVWELGGVSVNYLEVDQIAGDRVPGKSLHSLEAFDRETNERFRIRTRAVINAGGIFSDQVCRLVDPGARSRLTFSRGTHIVFGAEFAQNDHAILIPRTDDGRVLFAIPWESHLLIGTTDVPTEDPRVDPAPSESEIDYLLEHAGRYLSPAPRRDQITSAFAGIRPLVGSGEDTAKISREHQVEVSDSGMVSITGGKWTTYRVMARDAVDKAVAMSGLSPSVSRTESLKLSTARYQFDEDEDRVHPGLRVTRSSIQHAVREEMARTVGDLLARRSRSLFLEAAACREAAGIVAEVLAQELGHGPGWVREEGDRFRDQARSYDRAAVPVH